MLAPIASQLLETVTGGALTPRKQDVFDTIKLGLKTKYCKSLKSMGNFFTASRQPDLGVEFRRDGRECLNAL